jgi:hypothetical protein
MAKPAIVLAAILFATQAQAQWWNPNDPTPPKFRGTQFATKPVYNRALLMQAYTQVHVAIEEGNFDKIERMYAEFVETRLRASDGTWMVWAVQDAFDSWFYAMDDSRIARLLADWKQKVPDSKLRPVIEADMWQRTAWRARSGRGGGSLTPEMRQEFDERLRKASRALEASAEAGRDSPIWYWVALIVAGSSGRPQAQFDALFEEAVGKFPTYLPLYLTRMNYYLPQWGGSFEAVDAFVRRSEERTTPTDGKSFYAWLYVDVARKSGGDEGFFQATRVSWPRMRDSFDDMIRRYPDTWNKILYATFACLARDREATAKVLTMLPPDAQLGAYTDGISTDACRRFALEKS